MEGARKVQRGYKNFSRKGKVHFKRKRTLLHLVFTGSDFTQHPARQTT